VRTENLQILSRSKFHEVIIEENFFWNFCVAGLKQNKQQKQESHIK